MWFLRQRGQTLLKSVGQLALLMTCNKFIGKRREKGLGTQGLSSQKDKGGGTLGEEVQAGRAGSFVVSGLECFSPRVQALEPPAGFDLWFFCVLVVEPRGGYFPLCASVSSYVNLG